jgi:uncharacterized protein YndB with AHSA1/START domain
MMNATPPIVQQVETGSDLMKVTANFPQFTPSALFRYWVEPDLLTKWWCQQAEIAPKLGGSYHLSWNSMNWHLRGRYTAFEPGQWLAFTWKWDHEPDLPTREVDVLFDSAPDGGTILTVTHGRYTDSAVDQADRQSHFDGWMHFLTQLHGLASDTQTDS